MQRSARLGVMAALDRRRSTFPDFRSSPPVSFCAALPRQPGFHNDLSAFECGRSTLRDNPPWVFYARSGFADYPPGYFVVLWVWRKSTVRSRSSSAATSPPTAGACSGPSSNFRRSRWTWSTASCSTRLYGAMLRRRWRWSRPAFSRSIPPRSTSRRIGARSTPFSWGLILIALWCVLRAPDDPDKMTARLTWAWLAFAFSVLIKPQGATIGLLLLAYPFATGDLAVRARRIKGTLIGVAAACALTLAVSLLFHPSADVIGWLAGRYLYGSNVYQYKHRQRVQSLRAGAQHVGAGQHAAQLAGDSGGAARAVGRAAGSRRNGAHHRALPAAARRPRPARRRAVVRARVLRARDAHARAVHLRCVSAGHAADRLRPHRPDLVDHPQHHNVLEPGVLVRVPERDGEPSDRRRCHESVAADLPSGSAGERRALLLARLPILGRQRPAGRQPPPREKPPRPHHPRAPPGGVCRPEPGSVAEREPECWPAFGSWPRGRAAGSARAKAWPRSPGSTWCCSAVLS